MYRVLAVLTTLWFAVAGFVLSAPADAQRYHHNHRHSGARVGVFVGVPFYAPFYFPAPYYYHPYPYPTAVYAQPSAPPVYVERGDVEPPAEVRPGPAQLAPSQYWYFCPDSNTYYPYVKDCPSDWQRVIPQPPSANR